MLHNSCDRTKKAALEMVSNLSFVNLEKEELVCCENGKWIYIKVPAQPTEESKLLKAQVDPLDLVLADTDNTYQVPTLGDNDGGAAAEE